MNKIPLRVILLVVAIIGSIGVFSYVTREPRAETKQPKVTTAHAKTADKTGDRTATKTANETANETATKKVSRADTTKHGWGFVRNKLHEVPEISREQENVIKKYPVVFTLASKQKEIALTFDLGYENGYTSLILDTLKKHKVNATFFVTGYWLKKNPELLKRMIQEGHIVGNHTLDHPSLAEVSQERFSRELKGVENLIIKTAGKLPAPKLLRPPMGEYSEQSLQWARNMGYTTVFWSVALKDWEPLPSPQTVVKSVMANVHPGAVVLLHGVSKESSSALDELLNDLATEGYKVVPVKEVRL